MGKSIPDSGMRMVTIVALLPGFCVQNEGGA